MSYRESIETAEHGEVLRWSSGSEGEVDEAQDKTNAAQQDTMDSEEPTELGLVWKPWIIKETQYSDIEEIIENGKHEKNGTRFSIEAYGERSPVAHQKQPAISSNDASPSCSL